MGKAVDKPEYRETPIEIGKEEFRKIGYQLIDTIAHFFDTIKEYPVTQGESPLQLQKLVGNSGLPENGLSAEAIITKTTELLLNHSLFNGHPKFMVYITSSPAPIGVLANMLAAANPKHLTDTYSSHPEYYNFSKEEEGQSLNFYEYGLQNSRRFRLRGCIVNFRTSVKDIKEIIEIVVRVGAITHRELKKSKQ